jgi:hypothetical protein
MCVCLCVCVCVAVCMCTWSCVCSLLRVSLMRVLMWVWVWVWVNSRSTRKFIWFSFVLLFLFDFHTALVHGTRTYDVNSGLLRRAMPSVRDIRPGHRRPRFMAPCPSLPLAPSFLFFFLFFSPSLPLALPACFRDSGAGSHWP